MDSFNNFTFLWFGAAIFFLILEMTSPGLFLFLSFSGGALAGALICYLGFSGVIQVMSALSVTTLILLVLGVWLKRRAQFCGPSGYVSNVEALYGKKGIVIKHIEPRCSGQVKIGGQVWAARSVEAEAIPLGTIVEIICVQGVHVIVHPEQKRKGTS